MNGFGAPAGLVNSGAGNPGVLCGSTYGGLSGPPRGGSHVGTYGSVVPFSLEGGSSGGELNVYDAGCWQFLSTVPGGAGGGTLFLHAGGRIEVDGTVTADGYSLSSSGGSGGSILLRGDTGVFVLPGGSVSARGAQGPVVFPPWSPGRTDGAPGFVRLDSWAAAPVILGTVAPVPTALELPHLRAVSPPQIGRTWLLDVLAPENAPIFLSVSVQPAANIPTPFGPLGLNLQFATGFALTVAQPGHDPIASVPMAVPNAPILIGLSLWVQGFAIPQLLPPRLTNTLAAVVQ